jgi:hypothetical protein
MLVLNRRYRYLGTVSSKKHASVCVYWLHENIFETSHEWKVSVPCFSLWSFEFTKHTFETSYECILVVISYQWWISRIDVKIVWTTELFVEKEWCGCVPLLDRFRIRQKWWSCKGSEYQVSCSNSSLLECSHVAKANRVQFPAEICFLSRGALVVDEDDLGQVSP